MSVPEQSLSAPYNVEPILASSLQFPYRILPGNPFLLPYKFNQYFFDSRSFISSIILAIVNGSCLAKGLREEVREKERKPTYLPSLTVVP